MGTRRSHLIACPRRKILPWFCMKCKITFFLPFRAVCSQAPFLPNEILQQVQIPKATFCPNQRKTKRNNNSRRNKLSLRPFCTEKDLKERRALRSLRAEKRKPEQSRSDLLGAYGIPLLRAHSLLLSLPGLKELTAPLGCNRSWS